MRLSGVNQTLIWSKIEGTSCVAGHTYLSLSSELLFTLLHVYCLVLTSCSNIGVRALLFYIQYIDLTFISSCYLHRIVDSAVRCCEFSHSVVATVSYIYTPDIPLPTSHIQVVFVCLQTFSTSKLKLEY